MCTGLNRPGIAYNRAHHLSCSPAAQASTPSVCAVVDDPAKLSVSNLLSLYPLQPGLHDSRAFSKQYECLAKRFEHESTIADIYARAQYPAAPTVPCTPDKNPQGDGSESSKLSQPYTIARLRRVNQRLNKTERFEALTRPRERRHFLGVFKYRVRNIQGARARSILCDTLGVVSILDLDYTALPPDRARPPSTARSPSDVVEKY
ncbi:BQ2448_7501 [Microbotryum intermedium]|uniref:BQ2448_7501 protein n=1 Tax=Microbotryum intermedium TaxID=269621 RepID=A0A238FKA0_9BASI|nr:BQ2448_7501 [Microbotryum intermedium]